MNNCFIESIITGLKSTKIFNNIIHFTNNELFTHIINNDYNRISKLLIPNRINTQEDCNEFFIKFFIPYFKNIYNKRFVIKNNFELSKIFINEGYNNIINYLYNHNLITKPVLSYFYDIYDYNNKDNLLNNNELIIYNGLDEIFNVMYYENDSKMLIKSSNIYLYIIDNINNAFNNIKIIKKSNILLVNLCYDNIINQLLPYNYLDYKLKSVIYYIGDGINGHYMNINCNNNNDLLLYKDNINTIKANILIYEKN